MSTNPLTSIIGTQTLFDNGSARVTKVPDVDAEQMAAQAADAIYHKHLQDTPVTYDKPQIKVYTLGNHADNEARSNRVFELYTTGIAALSGDLEASYLNALTHLSSDVRDKDWGFSLRDGKLEVIENSDSLTSDERTQIRSTLQSAGVEYAAESVADAVIEMLELERGISGLSKGIGQYDVSQSNFADVVDLRRYIGEHLPGAKYAKGMVDPSDVETRYFASGRAMLDQITAKADSTYFGERGILVTDYGDDTGQEPSSTK